MIPEYNRMLQNNKILKKLDKSVGRKRIRRAKKIFSERQEHIFALIGKILHISVCVIHCHSVISTFASLIIRQKIMSFLSFLFYKIIYKCTNTI